jgi:DNA invertase Pin-like site-specific DNA recombinase
MPLSFVGSPTFEQNNDSQIRTLQNFVDSEDENIIVKPEHIYEEKISGYTDSRESLDKLITACETGGNSADLLY